MTATATYEMYMLQHPESTAPQATVESHLARVAAEISVRCDERGTTYEALVQRKGADVVGGIECDVAYRRCGRPTIDGVPQGGVNSFSQTVGDHTQNISWSTGNGNTSVLDSEWRTLGLYGQQIGWLGIPWGDE